MEYLLIFLSSYIFSPITAQLEIFKSALLCLIGIGALILCCRIISGHLSLDLDILGRRNLKLITIYQTIKDPDFLYLLKPYTLKQIQEDFYVRKIIKKAGNTCRFLSIQKHSGENKYT